jgi:PAS domain S-box-containing protein
MSAYTGFYILLLCVALFCTCTQAIYAWTQRSRPGAAYLSGYALAATLYMGASTFALISTDFPAKVLWFQVHQTGSVILPVMSLALILHALGQSHRLTPRLGLALSLEPLSVLLATWTNGWHGLIWRSFRLDADHGLTLLAYEAGPLQVAHFVYIYTFSVAALGWSLWQVRRLPTQDHRRVLLLLLGSLPPLAANVLSMLRLNPIAPIPLEPYSVALTTALWSWAMFQSRLLGVFLIAREDLIENMDDAVIVFDTAQRVVDLNTAAQALLRQRRDDVVGRPADHVLAALPGLARYLGRAAQTRVALDVAGQAHYYDLRTKPLRNPHTRLMGWLMILRDVTFTEQSDRIQVATYQIAQAAASAQSLPELYAAVHNILSTLLPLRNFYIALYDPEIDEVSFPYFVDERDRPPAPRRGARGLTEYVIRTRRPQLIPYRQVSQLQQAGEADNLGTEFVDWLGVPLASTDQVRGALVTVSYTEGQRLGDTEKKILTFVSTQISQAIERKQAEASLRWSEQRFRLLAENSLDVIARTDLQGRIHYISPACQAMLGYTPEELTGRSWQAIIHPDDLAQLSPGFNEILSNPDAPRTLCYRVLHKGGHPLWLEANLRIVRDPHTGVVTEIQSTARDITTRQLAEEALRTRERFLESLNAVTRVALETPDGQLMLNTLCEQLRAMFSADGGYLVLWDERQRRTQLVAGEGTERETFFRVAAAPDLGGLVDQLLAHGEPLTFHSRFGALAADIPVEVVQAFKMASVLVLPLIASDERLGLIVIAFDCHHDFTDDEIGQGQQAAGQIALALAKLHALALAERRAQEADTLRRAGAVVAGTLQQDEAIERILEQLATVVPYQTASVQLLRAGKMEVVGGRGWSDLSVVLGLAFPIPGDNPNTRVVQERQPVVYGDVTQVFPYFLDRADAYHIRGWLGVPMITKGELIGLITLDSAQPNYFTGDHARLAAAFADQVAVAIENARLYAALQQNAAELAALYRASDQLFGPSRDVMALAQRIVTTIHHEFTHSHCGLRLMDDSGEALGPPTETGDFVNPNPGPRVALHEPGLIPAAARTGTVIYAPDVARDPRYFLGHPDIRSELVVPLKVKERVIGVLDLESPQLDGFDEGRRRLVIAFAERAALALENAQLLARLGVAHREAQQANRLKSEFLANTSHELRTPLTGVLGSLDMVLDDMCDSPEEERQFLRTARQAGGRLLELINNLLDLSKIEAGKFELAAETLDLLPILAEVYSLLQIKAEEKKLKFNFQFPPEPMPLVWGDAGKVRQILLNLLGNAIKFTEQGDVTLSIRPDLETRQLCVIVQDTGIGIPKDQQANVFEPFFQIDGSTTRRYGGTGLGLSIAQRLAAMMNGHIELYSPGPGQGSIFVLTLPLANSNSPPPSAQSPKAR